MLFFNALHKKGLAYIKTNPFPSRMFQISITSPLEALLSLSRYKRSLVHGGGFDVRYNL
jgi:hypothetical protein